MTGLVLATILLHVGEGAGIERPTLVNALEVRGVEVGVDPLQTLVAVTANPQGAGCRIVVRDPKGAILADHVLPAEADLSRTAALAVVAALKTEPDAEAARASFEAERIDFKVEAVRKSGFLGRLGFKEPIFGRQGGPDGATIRDLATLYRKIDQPELVARTLHRKHVGLLVMIGGYTLGEAGAVMFLAGGTGRSGTSQTMSTAGSVALLTGMGVVAAGIWHGLNDPNPVSHDETAALVEEHNRFLREHLGLPPANPEPEVAP